MSDKAEANRRALQQYAGRQPFHKFIIGFESGDRYEVRHPENLAFDPESGGNADVSILLQRVSVLTSLDAITGVARVVEDVRFDRPEAA
jgi:hypothetical protein